MGAVEQKPIDEWWFVLIIFIMCSLTVAGYIIYGLVKLAKLICKKYQEAKEKRRITCDSSAMPDYDAFYDDL